MSRFVSFIFRPLGKHMVTSYLNGMSPSAGRKSSSGSKSYFWMHDAMIVVTVSSENSPPMHERGPAPKGV